MVEVSLLSELLKLPPLNKFVLLADCCQFVVTFDNNTPDGKFKLPSVLNVALRVEF